MENMEELLTDHSLQGANQLYKLLSLLDGSLFISPARREKFKCYNEIKIDNEKQVNVGYFK
jgi:hypothetical protein